MGTAIVVSLGEHPIFCLANWQYLLAPLCPFGGSSGRPEQGRRTQGRDVYPQGSSVLSHESRLRWPDGLRWRRPAARRSGRPGRAIATERRGSTSLTPTAFSPGQAIVSA